MINLTKFFKSVGWEAKLYRGLLTYGYDLIDNMIVGTMVDDNLDNDADVFDDYNLDIIDFISDHIPCYLRAHFADYVVRRCGKSDMVYSLALKFGMDKPEWSEYITSPAIMCMYASDVARGRVQRFEPYIMAFPGCAEWYARNVIYGPWSEAEVAIANQL